MRWIAPSLATALLVAAWGDNPVALRAAPQDARQSASVTVATPLLVEIERVLAAGDPASYLDLLHPDASRERASIFSAAEVRAGATRVAVRERDRQPLDASTPEAGFRLVLDAFTAYGDRARVATWQIDVRPAGVRWRIADQQRLSVVDSLYRLSLDTRRRFRARNFTVTAEDLELTLVDGHVYHVNADDQLTGLLLLGRGEMRFAPAPDVERRQIEIVAGDETLTTRFDSAYVRAAAIDVHVDRSGLQEVPLDNRELQVARQVFLTESVKTYVIDLGDLSSETWSLLPAGGDFLAEVDTRRFDSLTYVRARSEPEDVLVFDRPRQRTISAYPSRERLASAGPFFSEERAAQYDVIDYEVDAAFSPQRLWIDGRTRMRIRTRESFTGQMNVKLADPLVVHAVESDEFGRLFHLRARGQNLVVINLPGLVMPGTEFSVTITYAGRLMPQAADRETAQADTAGQPPRGQNAVRLPTAAMAGEPVFLYSSRSYWYAQNPTGGYSTATLRISVPANLSVIATGMPAPDSPRDLEAAPGAPPRRVFEFTADRPVRYLAFIASRFASVDRVTLALDDNRTRDAVNASGSGPAFSAPAISGAVHTSVDLVIEAHPLQASGGRQYTDRAADVLRFYHSLIGDAPYGSFTLALVESPQPGGHSPAYFATLNQRLPNAPPVWRTDPVNFASYPDFYLAHEVAHQWWGQAVGWANYHEQWLSEGVSQYFAALYAEEAYGPEVFGDVLRQMRQWAIDRSDQGPVYLGYRLGHVRNDSRTFRALVYNKGAAVLHMLRRFIGDEAFFRGLRRFYVGARYRRVGTEDLRYAMELESDRSLERFFERWIYEAGIPEIRFAYLEHTAPDHEVAVRIEQTGDEVFDLPVTLTLEFQDRTTRDVVIRVTEVRTEVRLPLEKSLRSLRMSDRDGTLAEARRVSY